MSPKEIMQLAAVLNAKAQEQLAGHKNSALVTHALSMLDELPGILENAFDEAKCLDELAAETRRQQSLVNFRFRFGI